MGRAEVREEWHRRGSLDMVMVQNLHLVLSTIVGYRDVGSGG